MSFLSDKSSAQAGRGRRTKNASLEATVQTSKTRASKAPEDAGGEKQDFKVNEDGRYVCPICDKTFKTVRLFLGLFSVAHQRNFSQLMCFHLEQNNILRTHLRTHSDLKGFSCDLCGTSFRTKGSLIRHNRRHTGTVNLSFYFSSFLKSKKRFMLFLLPCR